MTQQQLPAGYVDVDLLPAPVVTVRRGLRRRQIVRRCVGSCRDCDWRGDTNLAAAQAAAHVRATAHRAFVDFHAELTFDRAELDGRA